MVKLFSGNNETAIIVYANQKPVALSLNTKLLTEVYLPKLIRMLDSEKVPSLMFC
jgi:hypothetical protein